MIHYVPFGAPAMERLKQELERLKTSDALAPVTVIVPSNIAGLHLRRQLVQPAEDGGPGLANVRFSTLKSVVELLGTSTLSPGRFRLDRTMSREAARAALSQTKEYSQFANHPATVAAFERTLREIRGAQEGALDGCVNAGGAIGELYVRYRSLCSGFYDEEDLIEAASRGVGSNAVRANVGAVVLYLPEPADHRTTSFLRLLLENYDSSALVGLTGDDADKAVLEWSSRLRLIAAPVEQPPIRPAPNGICALLTDAHEEVRYAVRETMRLAAEGTPFSRIAILSPSQAPYQRLLEDALTAAQIPVHGQGLRKLRETPTGRALEGFVRLGHGEFKRSDLIDWLTAVPLKDAIGVIPGHLWNQITREAGVTRGVSNWQELLQRYARHQRSLSSAEAAARANEADRIVAFIQWLQPHATLSFPTWKYAADAFVKLLDENLDSEGFSDSDAGFDRLTRDGLAQLPLLDHLPVPPQSESVALAVSDILDTRVPQSSRYGSGVFRGVMRDAMGLDFDHVFLLGMSEDAPPALMEQDPVLPDHLRGEVLPKRATTELELRRGYDAVRSLAPTMSFIAPRADRDRGRPLMPSLWFLEEAARLANDGKPMYSTDLEKRKGESWLFFPSSVEADLRDSTSAPASLQDFNLTSLLNLGDHVERHRLFGEKTFLQGYKLQRERLSTKFSEYDGNIGDNLWLDSAILSASSLETYAACPHRFFYKSILRVRESDEPEELDSIDSMERGNLIHRVLKKYIDGGFDTVEEIERIAVTELDILETERVVSPGLLWNRKRQELLECARQFVGANQRLCESFGSKPVDTEWRFGEEARFELQLANQTLFVQGSIDRVDEADDGSVVVVDYKTGSPGKYKKLEADPFSGGELVQLPLYGLVAAQVRGRSSAIQAVYLVWDKAKIEWKQFSLELSSEGEHPTKAEFEENLAHFLDSMRQGVFPARPGDRSMGSFDNCKYCPYDRCCPSDRDVAWTRIQDSPSLYNLNLVATRYAPATSDFPPPQQPAVGEIALRPTIKVEDDEHVRISIRSDLDQTLFVEAGAGTGKTTSLVSRIAAMATQANQPFSLSKLAAITYTRKAAAELQERLRMELESRARDNPADSVQKALEELGAATIGTIDGFARKILASHPLAAGLPPGFSVLDELESQLRFQEWWSNLLDELLGDPALESAWNAAFDLSLDPSHFRTFAIRLHQRWEVAPSQGTDLIDLIRQGWQVAFDQVCYEGTRLLHMAEEACTNRTDKLFERSFADCDDWLQDLAAWTFDGDHQPFIDCLRREWQLNVGSAANWSGRLQEIKQEIKKFRELAYSFRDSLNLAPLLPILARISEAVSRFAEERRQAGELEFRDLLVLAVRLLRGNPDVLEQLRAQYQRILVDEFQDTDPLQIELFTILASSGPPAEDWRSAKILPGRLFLVGDPKQSLYRFRGAEVGLYELLKKLLVAEPLMLTRNFRSHETVIQFVNDTFARLLDRPGQALAVDLGCSRSEGSYAGVHVFGGPRPDGSAQAMRAAEASSLAKTIRLAVPGGSGSKGWQVYDKPSCRLRDAKLRDIAVLIPTRTALPEIEQALESAKIPYRIDSRSLLYGTQQVRDLLNLLRAIDDPTDQVAIVAALRSPALACSDRDLFEHQRGWDYMRAIVGEPGPVGAALSTLRKFHEIRHQMPVASLVSKVVRECRLMELAIAQRRPRDQWLRIGLLLNDAQRFDETEGGTLRRFLSAIDLMAENDASINEAVVEEEDDDAIRILTIHASKGLEYPIAMLLGLGSRPRSQDSASVFWAQDGTIEFSIGPKESGARTSGAGRFVALEKEQAELEDDRKLYVGATRARDHLVIGLNHKPATSASGSTMAERLCNAIDFKRVDQLDLSSVEMQPSQARPLAEYEGRTYEEWKAFIDKTIQSATPTPNRAPTTIVKEIANPETESEDEKADEGREEMRPRGGADLGRAVHTALQTLDLTAPSAHLEEIVHTQAAAESQDPSDVRRLVESALRSPPVIEAGFLPHWKEMFLSAYSEGVLLEGYIDLIFRRPDGEYVVVDYKTDGAYTEAAVDERMNRYQWQAGAYALMMQQTLGKPPKECYFIFLRKADRNVRSVPNLAAATERVRRHLSSLQSGGLSGKDANRG
jgi:ATP-dependent helicase/nuclease subunit A